MKCKKRRPLSLHERIQKYLSRYYNALGLLTLYILITRVLHLIHLIKE
nr:MAG TPA: hypothetical protein [Caudoviricetes sp.]